MFLPFLFLYISNLLKLQCTLFQRKEIIIYTLWFHLHGTPCIKINTFFNNCTISLLSDALICQTHNNLFDCIGWQAVLHDCSLLINITMRNIEHNSNKDHKYRVTHLAIVFQVSDS